MKKLLILLFISCSICARAELYAVFVGVSKYNDTSPEAPYLDGEARKMRDLFSKPDNPNAMLITNERATKSNILAALKAQIKRAKENDQLLFFYAGRCNNGNISAYDEINGISYDEINEIFTTSSARTKIIMMDNCNTDTENYHLENKAINTFKSENLFVLLSSLPNEKSIGSTELACSYFTHYLAEGIQGKADLNADGKIDAFELYAYVNIRVSDRTDNRQHPVMTGTIDGEKALFGVK